MIPTLPEGITLVKSHSPGPTIAILAGVHGDERAGILAFKNLLKTCKPTRGSIFFILGNLRAVQKNVRFTESNLNRCFIPNIIGDSYEQKRAREIMPILDACDALLDLHGFKDTAGDPVSICDEPSVKVARKLLPPIVSTGWGDAEPGGSDTYMHMQGKIGITVECGPIADSASNGRLVAEVAVHQFLKYFGMIDTPIPFSTKKKKHVQVHYAVKRTSENFTLREGMHNFQELSRGEVYGQQDGQDFVAEAGDVIIFPRPHQLIGHEAFIIGKVIR